MSARNYLLFIDECPVPKELEQYFARFNIDIKIQKNLNPINTETKRLLALVIHWRMLEQEPHVLFHCYQSYTVPILVINDTHNAAACVLVLENGADDYLFAPIIPQNLHARIITISRRIGNRPSILEPQYNALQFGTWRLYPASRQVFDEQDNELSLSAGEYDLLYSFVQNPQCVLDREFLSQITKQADHTPFDRRIDVQISRLRQKIEVDAKSPALIVTVRNGGYMFNAVVEKAGRGLARGRVHVDDSLRETYDFL